MTTEVGKKFDFGKLRWRLLPWDAAKEVVKVLMFGACKYGEFNWQALVTAPAKEDGSQPDGRTRVWEASIRHLTAYIKGEKLDQESGLPHLAHAACNLFFLMWADCETSIFELDKKGQ